MNLPHNVYDSCVSNLTHRWLCMISIVIVGSDFALTTSSLLTELRTLVWLCFIQHVPQKMDHLYYWPAYTWCRGQYCFALCRRL